MLAWILPLSFSFIGFILAIGFINSKSTVNNLVYDEFDNKYESFNKKHDEILKNLKVKNEEILNEIEEIRNRLTAEVEEIE